MNENQKQSLLSEVEMQIKALKRIEQWKRITFLLSMMGVGLVYAGAAGTKKYVSMIIPGIILILVSTICAIVFNLGLKNGRKNVEKMLNVLDKGAVS